MTATSILVWRCEIESTSGVDGIVRVRIPAEGRAEVIDGPSPLTEAAVANARTWTFVQPPERPFEVEYRYRLLPGDCSANQNPAISMRFPKEVEITATRRLLCGPPIIPVSARQ